MVTVQGGQTVMNMQYLYPAQNAGRVAQTIDGVAGETVSYTYDSLNRLSAAVAGTWSQAYVYDGFGNVLGMNGAAVNSINSLANRAPSGYDANGLPSWTSWNVENQWTNNGTITYEPYGRRVMKSTGSQSWEIYFYGLSGQKLTMISCQLDGNQSMSCGAAGNNMYFGGKLISSNGRTVATDRLGSVRATAVGERMRYLPYGQELTGTADGREKFAGYFRDGAGQDYAEQRYYGQGGVLDAGSNGNERGGFDKSQTLEYVRIRRRGPD